MSFASTPIRTVLSLAIFFLCLVPAPAQAVVDGIPVPCNERRFDCVGMFFTAGTSPGPCGGGISGTCILIAPDQILIKRHQLNISASQPLSAIGATLFRARFQRTPDGNAVGTYLYNGDPCHGNYQEVFVSSFVDPPVQGSDTVLAYLAQPIVNIQPASLDLTTLLPAGTNIILAGWGYAGECFASGDHWTLRTSRGKLPYDANSDSFWFTPCGIGTIAPCLSCPPGGPWVAANLHDSGGGIFIEVPSPDPAAVEPELHLIGTVSTTGTAQRLTAFNNAGGQPQLVQTPPQSVGVIGDFNRDGVVNMQDAFSYFTAFFGGVCEADINLDGKLTLTDLFTFLAAFFLKR